MYTYTNAYTYSEAGIPPATLPLSLCLSLSSISLSLSLSHRGAT